MSPTAMRTKLESLGVAPLTRNDIVNVLLNPFVDRHRNAIDYAKIIVGLSSKEIRDLVEEVAIKCLEIGCKGKLLRRLVEGYPQLKDIIAAVVVEKYQLGLEHLPDSDDEDMCARYRASLCREYCFLVGPEITEQQGEAEDAIMAELDEAGIEEEDVDELESLPGDEAHRDASELVSVITSRPRQLYLIDRNAGYDRSRHAHQYDSP